MRLRTKSLEVRKSTIPKAGLGLFARRSFRKGELVGYFKGELISDRKASSLKSPHQFYLIDLGKDNNLDVYESASLAKFANDAEGLVKVRSRKNNSTIYACSNQQMAFISATQDIEANEEIFLEYGKDYWDVFKNI